MKENIGKQMDETKQTLFKTIRKMCNLWRKNRGADKRKVFTFWSMSGNILIKQKLFEVCLLKQQATKGVDMKHI